MLKTNNVIKWRQAYEGADKWLHSFLTSAPDGRQGSASPPSRFICGKEPRYPLIRGMSGPKNQYKPYGESLANAVSNN